MLSLALAALSAPPLAAGLRSSYEIETDLHISQIMPVFSTVELNFEWAERMTHQELVHTRDLGQLVYQQHALPWPLSPRDLLLSCDIRADARDAVFESACKSVDHPSMPSPKGVVRVELERTMWRMEALPGGRTKLHLEMAVPAAATVGVPSSIVKHVQRTSLRDSVTALLAAVRRLNMPPAKQFLHWRRSRAEVAAAQLSVPALHSSPWMLLRWVLSLGETSWLCLAALLIGHCVAFACLARARRTWFTTASVDGPHRTHVHKRAPAEPTPLRLRALRLHGGMFM